MKKKLSCTNFHKVQFYEFSPIFFVVVVQVFIQRKESSYIREKTSKQDFKMDLWRMENFWIGE